MEKSNTRINRSFDFVYTEIACSELVESVECTQDDGYYFRLVQMNNKNKYFIQLLVACTLFFAVSLLISRYGFNNLRLGKTEERAGSVINDLTGEISYNERNARFENKLIEIPEVVFVNNENDKQVLGLASEERWVEVDLSDQKLYAWEGNNLFFETLVSTGLPWYPTPTGEFRVWIKLRAAKMEGGQGKLYYYLPNVPYVMYFGNSEIPNWRGYGLHGTYWHNDFGNQHSHGCVNLPTEIAKKLYYWINPVLPEGKSVVWADETNPGSRVVIHE